MKNFDLHMHSLYSGDADLPVNNLINLAKENNVSLLSVTDHNSSKSVKESIKYGEMNDINILTGIEIDCSFQGGNFHLLGYGYDKNTSDFDVVESDFIKLQQEATPIKLNKIRDLGIYLDEEYLYKHAKGIIPLEEEMAELILDDKRNDKNNLLRPYRDGNERSDMPLINFFWDFFGFGKPCHVEINYPSMSKVVDIIRANSGIPVIAHIGANVKSNHTDVINEMLSAGVMGVEVFSSYHNKKLSELLYDYSLSKSIFVTCGSDFHGKNKPKIMIGSCKYSDDHCHEIEKLTQAVTIY